MLFIFLDCVLLLRRDPLLVKMREAVETGEADPEVAPYVPQSRHCTREAFEASGWRAAFGEEA